MRIDRRSHRYLVVYGACVARQVFDRMDRGLGAPDERDMDGYIEEAHEIAEMTMRAEERADDARMVELEKVPEGAATIDATLSEVPDA